MADEEDAPPRQFGPAVAASPVRRAVIHTGLDWRYNEHRTVVLEAYRTRNAADAEDAVQDA
jgi:hypothetical protein